MKKVRTVTFVGRLIFCSVLGYASVSTVSAADKSADLTALNKIVLQLENRVKELSNDVGKVEVKIKDVSSEKGSSMSSPNEVAQINAKLDAILQVLQISGSDVTIRSSGRLKIEAANDLSLKSGSQLKLESAGNADIKSGGMTAIQGSIIKFNNGTRPVAAVGDTTVGNQSTQKIVSGNSQVFID